MDYWFYASTRLISGLCRIPNADELAQGSGFLPEFVDVAIVVEAKTWRNWGASGEIHATETLFGAAGIRCQALSANQREEFGV